MSKRPALGKGIGALLDPGIREESHRFFFCPIEELRPLKNQPRKVFDDQKLSELEASIRARGIIQPLVVRRLPDHYQIIAGERRWRAAQRAGLKKVPVLIQEATEDAAVEMALIENIQRENLNPIEEAAAYQSLIQAFQLTQEEVAGRVGKDRSTVTNCLRLLRLPEVVREDLATGTLAMGHARALLSLEAVPAQLLRVREQVLAKNLSVRETEALVKRAKKAALSPPPPPKKIDPNLQALEDSLKQSLGTKVKIVSRKKGGKIEINFFSAQDLDRLLEKLGISC
ncbi:MULTISPECIES: ParB/RepB/Spo0J family partition protein [Syntrophotalea]|jgi:ParB family chromosome partitioning protein|uniref:Chromosome partitioning protein ParB n=1 Tax=Syntrophotalea acetylenica TaxID=29542 RepID=A0A1L3GFW7_SYNAC|nr:ParB/RepB/Spo0J family partition protein [Syntrophotalea acetylenica]APG24735.1 chromosome partitioning protein ParB [Syntrophotalea acetylenica]APG42791.1 chromosome partitioning protein ParB [Syntrophotalea acetylenica]MDY0261712.1 ParB/RepB/Spo0J family partition protein [Syntrophotalea acetylenica]